MAEHNEKGKAGEALAVSHLQRKGYDIIEQNWRFEKAEVDIIAKHKNTLVFVEVKARKSEDFGEPELAVTRKKQRLICKAANAYVQNLNIVEEIRFDIVTVLFDQRPPQVRHTEDAFYPLI